MDTKARYQCMVSLSNNGKYEVLLTINDNNLIFEKKKGLFNKQYKVFKEIVIKDIKKFISLAVDMTLSNLDDLNIKQMD